MREIRNSKNKRQAIIKLLRDKVELQSKVKKPADNVIMMPAEEYDFGNSFLRGKSINAVNGFKNLLIKIFS